MGYLLTEILSKQNRSYLSQAGTVQISFVFDNLLHILLNKIPIDLFKGICLFLKIFVVTLLRITKKEGIVYYDTPPFIS